MPYETVRMSNKTYKVCVVGLSGIGVGKPAADDLWQRSWFYLDSFA